MNENHTNLLENPQNTGLSTSDDHHYHDDCNVGPSSTLMLLLLSFLFAIIETTSAAFFSAIPEASTRFLPGSGGSSKRFGVRAKQTYDCDTENVNNRRIDALTEWASTNGVRFARGVDLISSGNEGDLGIISNTSLEKGSPILSVPNKLVLSSETNEAADGERREFIRAALSSTVPGMEIYLPECLLIVQILEQTVKGCHSFWGPWLESLPITFATPLYMDDVERSHVKRLAPKFVHHQDCQWKACSRAIQELLRCDDSLRNISELLAHDSDALLWAFSVAFTRSWRTPNRHAVIVPMGDMFNHDSQNANIVPRNNDSDHKNLKNQVELVLSRPALDPPNSLHLSYGLAYYPERFLVNFGFCDQSSPLVHVNLDTTELSVDCSQVVACTKTGALSEDTWNVALYNILKMEGSTSLGEFKNAYKQGESIRLSQLHSTWEPQVLSYLKQHATRMLEQVYLNMPRLTEEEKLRHPHLDMIFRYNTMMRGTWIKVLQNLSI